MAGQIPKVRTLSNHKTRNFNIDVAPASRRDLPALHAFISDVLGGGIASMDTVEAVHRKQAFSIWQVKNAEGETSGVFAFLYLNEAGLAAVKGGDFNSAEPSLDHLAGSPDAVVGIFAWCMVLNGRAKAALLKAATWLDLCGWTDCPIFTNPVTDRGSRLAQSLGFRPFGGENGRPHLHAVI